MRSLYTAPLLALCLFLPTQGWAAVAYGSGVNVTPGTGTNTGASPSITTPTTNPVVVAAIAIRDSIGGRSIDSLTITGFGGTAAFVIDAFIPGGSDMTVALWCIKAPAANTAGTVQANFSASVAEYDMAVFTFSGADQTDPCPTGDAVTSVTTASPQTMTPTNLTANDATVGASSTRVSGANVGAITTAVYTDATDDLDLAVGYVLGTGGTSHTVTTGIAFGKIATRIVAASGSAPDVTQFYKRRPQ